MRNFKKIIVIFLSAIFLCVLGVACKNNNNNSSENEPKFNITEDEISIKVDESYLLTVEGDKIEGVSWASDNPLVASVDENGKITGLTEGFCIITATAGEDSDACKVEVVAASENVQTPFPQLILSHTSVDMLIGGEFPVDGEVYYDGNLQDNVTLQWSSSDTTIVDVDGSGANVVLQAKDKVGTATITVSVNFESIYLEERITVIVKNQSKLVLSDTELDFALFPTLSGEYVSQPQTVKILEIEFNNVPFTGDVEVSLENESEDGIISWEYADKQIEIRANKFGDATLKVSFTVGEETFSSDISISAHQGLLSGVNASHEMQEFNGETVTVWNIEKEHDTFAFTSEYVESLKENGVKAVRVWMKNTAVQMVAGENMPIAGSADVQTAEDWFAFSIGRRYYDKNYKPETLNPNYWDNSKFSYFDTVLTPNGLSEFEIKFANNTSTGVLYVECFENDYPVLSGVNGVQKERKDLFVTRTETINGEETIVYRVETMLDNDADRGKGFKVSSAYVEDLKALGATNVKVYYKSDGQVYAMQGYFYTEDGWMSAMWNTPSDEWTVLMRSNTEALNIAIEDLERTHFCFGDDPYATWVELYLEVQVPPSFDEAKDITVEGVNGWLQEDGNGVITLPELESSATQVWLDSQKVTASVSNGIITLDIGADKAMALGFTLGADYDLYVKDDNGTVYKTQFKYVTKAITNFEEFNSIRNDVSNYLLRGYYYVVNDIDATGKLFAGINANLAAGAVLDGGYHTIKNLVIDHPNDTNSQSAQYNAIELFASTYANSTVKNITFENITMETDTDAINMFKWSLIGSNMGTIENVILALGAQSFRAFEGLAGTNSGIIQNCVVNTTRVTEVDWKMTSYITASNTGTVTNCIANVVNTDIPLIATDDNAENTTAYILMDNTKALVVQAIENYGLPTEVKGMYEKLTVLELTGISYSKEFVSFGDTTVEAFAVTKPTTNFAFTADYIDSLKVNGIKAVRVYSQGAQIYFTADSHPNAYVGFDWVGSASTSWQVINFGGRYNTSGNYATQSVWNTVLTPDELAQYSFTWATANSTSAYFYVETLTDNYALTGIAGVASGYDDKAYTVNAVEDNTVYKVNVALTYGGNYGGQNYGNGFMLSSALIAELQAQGVKSFDIMFRTDKGGAFALQGYSLDVALDANANYASAILGTGEEYKTLITGVSIDDAMKTHIHLSRVNGSELPTYIEFYLVLKDSSK